LINEPHVSHFRLAAHLSTALLTFGFTFWVLLDLMYPTNNDSIISLKDTRLNDIVGQAKSAKETAIQHSTFNIQHLSLVLLVFVGIQIIYGAFTSGLHAGQFDPTFPKMGNSWIAPEVFSLNPWWDNFLYNPAGVQFIHRYNAYIVVTLVFIIVYKSKKIEMGQSQKRGLNFLMFMVLIQFLLGVFTLVYSVPVVLGVLHQTGAFMLFSSVLYLLHQLKQLTIHN
jgi:cytochrome c oxidase assembly protein subunit 15